MVNGQQGPWDRLPTILTDGWSLDNLLGFLNCEGGFLPRGSPPGCLHRAGLGRLGERTGPPILPLPSSGHVEA